jgi:hypothetical protein
MKKRIRTIQQFYALMFLTKGIRERIVNRYFENRHIKQKLAESLSSALEHLEDIPKDNGKYRLLLRDDMNIHLDLTYEIEELRKDLYFLKHSQDDFQRFLEKLHPGFSEQISEGEHIFKGIHFQTFITDRDGTVNNYCGRYESSIQSIYNSIYLTRFAIHCARNSVILTSAPIDNVGLLDISINPSNTFIYAGSKGREYIDTNGNIDRFPIEKEKQEKLDILNKRLSELVKKPDYEIFSLIGSGLQFKFGQTTISRQDIYGTIPEDESRKFLMTVSDMVYAIDPGRDFFVIEDTGKDIEIILTIKWAGSSLEPKDFDKGDGVTFLNRQLNLNMAHGPNLVCGDTVSDIPMVSVSMENTTDTWAVFVSDDDELKRKVMAVCPNSFFVTQPDILVSLFNILSKGM